MDEIERFEEWQKNWRHPMQGKYETAAEQYDRARKFMGQGSVKHPMQDKPNHESLKEFAAKHIGRDVADSLPEEYTFMDGEKITPTQEACLRCWEPNTATRISHECDEIKDMLLEKNRKYGDSALNPIRIMSKATAEEQLLVRIDDKLSRLKNLQSDDTEDTVRDLIGYLVLLLVARDH